LNIIARYHATNKQLLTTAYSAGKIILFTETAIIQNLTIIYTELLAVELSKVFEWGFDGQLRPRIHFISFAGG